MKQQFHKEYPEYIIHAKKELSETIKKYNSYTRYRNNLVNGIYESGHYNEGMLQYTTRIDQLRSIIMDYESEYNSDAYGYMTSSPDTDEDYINRIANGYTIGGMKL